MTSIEEPDLTGTPAEVYERHLVPRFFLPWARDLVALAEPKPGDRALDVACGTGAVTRLLAERVGENGKVIGLDLNSGMLAVARSGVAAANVEWREASALDLPFPDGSFNVVLCQQGLQFFPDRSLALREIRRVLVSEGRLALACWRDLSASPGYAAMERALARHVPPEQAKLPPFALGDAEELRRLVSGAGFRDVEVRAETKTMRWPSIDLFVRATVAAAPTMLGALSEQSETVLTQIAADVEADVRRFREADGAFSFPMGNHVVIGRA